MCPQFVDFNADGYDDIITATFEGTAFIVEGSAAGWQEPKHLKDAQGRNIVLSLFYDMEENTYKNAERSPSGTTNPSDHCVSAMVWDWDGSPESSKHSKPNISATRERVNIPRQACAPIDEGNCVHGHWSKCSPSSETVCETLPCNPPIGHPPLLFRLATRLRMISPRS